MWPLLALQGVVTAVAYLFLIALGTFTMAIPSFLVLLGLKGPADAVHAWGQSNSLGALVVSVPGGVALPLLAAAGRLQSLNSDGDTR
jgi:hypothetical protein